MDGESAANYNFTKRWGCLSVMSRERFRCALERATLYRT